MGEAAKRRSWAWGLLCGALASGCGRGHDAGPKAQESTAVTRAALQTAPAVGSFAIYAANSVSLKDRAIVQGGDVGVALAGPGPFLVSGYELGLSSDARVDLAHDVLADRVYLTDRATVGDVEATTLTNHFGNYSELYPLPAMPPLPGAAPVSPGSTNIAVSAGTVRTLVAGAYGAVNVQGKLQLAGGTYDLASVSLGNDARLEALASAQVHIAGRLSTADRARIAPATGSGLAAGELRIEVSGSNGATGALTASPKAAAFGNDNVLTAVLLAPNGTLQTGHRMNVTGALFGRDVLVNLDSTVTFQSGFVTAGCGSCDDGNPCTADACSGGTCTHAAAADGTACNDGDACTQADSCAAGACVGANPVVCAAIDACHLGDVRTGDGSMLETRGARGDRVLGRRRVQRRGDVRRGGAVRARGGAGGR